jgi:hypothetical protein
MNYRKNAGFFFVSDAASTGSGCIDVVSSFEGSIVVVFEVDGTATNTKKWTG